MAMSSESTTARPRGRPPRTADAVDATRSRIARVAIGLFREEGYASVSMRRLAQEAGCTPATLYAYFASKTEILRHIWAEVFEGLFHDLDRLAEGIDSPRERLAAVSRAYVSFWVDHPETYRVVFMTEGVTQPEVGVFVDRAAGRYALFFDAMRQSWAPKADATDVSVRTQALLCSLQGVAHTLITVSGYGWAPVERLVDTLVEALLPPRLPLWIDG
jgi:AcrR family transcriptional regulator